MMRISKKGLALIKHYEGCRLEAYLCPAKVWTIGYGHTGPEVKKGMKITQEEAERLLLQDLVQFERDVLSLLKVQPTQGQFDALVSFAFNVGSDIDADTLAEGLGDSTLLKKLNVGNVKGAADQFLLWVKAGGKVLPGLQKRRQDERALFLGLPYTLD